LASVTRAKPKIADYPFTTLHPQLGVVYCHDREFVLADLPGLIENAHQGTGLGHRFLGHIERCNVLLHLIDATQDDIEQAYLIIRQELKQYHPDLPNKPEVIALNKCDALLSEVIEEKVEILKKISQKPVHQISAVAGQNVQSVLNDLLKYIDKRED
jgi:GTP-binding protein